MTVTETDCVETLKAKLGHGNFIVERFSFASQSERLGFLSNQGELTVTIRVGSSSETHRFFVKLFSGWSSRFADEFLLRFKYSSKELGIVQRLIPELEDVASKKITAKCFYGVSDRFMVLENLSEFGFELNRLPKMDLNHARVGIEALAHFHALSFIKERQLNESLGERYKDMLFETLFAVLEDDPELGFLYAGDQRLRGFIKECLDEFPNVDKYVDRLTQECINVSKPSTEFKNIICHGDCWANNILYKYDRKGIPRDAVLIDFQAARFVPPAHDLVYFMRMNFSPEFRQIIEKQILTHYFDTLTTYLLGHNIQINDALPECEFWKSYEYFNAKYGALLLVYCTPPAIPKEFIHVLFGDDEEMFETIAKGNVSNTLKVLKLSPDFKNLITNRLIDVLKHYKVEECET